MTKTFSLSTWLTAVAAIFLLSAASSQATLVLFSDNFNAPDTTNLDNSDQTGRNGGLLGDNVIVRSARAQQHINGGQWLSVVPASGSGRIRFHDENNLGNRWNFADPTGGTEILAGGGFQVSFDWTPVNNTDPNWISVNAGISTETAGEAAVRVNNAETDFGILFRHNGGSQHFDNGAGLAGGTVSATAGPRHVVVDFAFDSFADGTSVIATASVDGSSVLGGRTFDWDNNAGVLWLEIGAQGAGELIDNLMITTIPEPSAAILFGLGVGLLGVFRRR